MIEYCTADRHLLWSMKLKRIVVSNHFRRLPPRSLADYPLEIGQGSANQSRPSRLSARTLAGENSDFKQLDAAPGRTVTPLELG